MPKEFDPEQCELNGINIVEAGAGTGKTYTIQKLVLRILLEKEIPLPKILVVTFTVAATGELLERLHAILQQTKDVLELENASEAIKDSQYDQIRGILNHLQVEKQEQRLRCLKLVRNALQDYDQAAVMTIHGFCQRMLMDNAMQSFIRYGVELRTDYSELRYKIAMDFCRTIIYSKDLLTLGFNLDADELLEKMGCAVSNAFNDTEILFDNTPEIGSKGREKMIQKIMVAEFWDPLRKIKTDYLKEAGKTFLKKNWCKSFSELTDRIVSAVQEKRDFYVLNIAKALTHESLQNYLNQQKKESKTFLNNPEFESFFKGISEIIPPMKMTESEIGKRFLEFYKSELEKYKANESFLTFEDLISRMTQMVNSPQGDALCRNIRNAYSYVFVDEFQDTDPGQFSIFSKIFGEKGKQDSGFFMIGDPKQAIYSFRGGDVYAYLDAVSKVPAKHRYTLTHNYRSGEKYIDSLNAFYQGQEKPFNLPQIGFSKIIWGGTVKKNLYYHDSPAERPLQFCELENKDDVIVWTINKVLDLLSCDRYFIGSEDEKKQPVKASDIAILFPTKAFGSELEKALNAKNIDTIWMSESDIFQQPEALVIWRFLQMLYNGVRLRDMASVLSDGLFMFTATEIQRLQQEADDRESPGILAQKYFADLRKTWESKGIYAMFRELLNVSNGQGRPWLSLVRDEDENGIGDRFQDNATLAVHILRSDEINGPYILGHIRQLVDKLHQAAQKYHFSPGGLLFYLRGMINQEISNENSGLVQHIQRNTDSPAVRLMTLHASKGLEFPIVLLPNVPTYKNTYMKDRLYHDGGKRVADMTGWMSNTEPLKSGPAEEFLDEKLRLLYVGLTRAKYACYVPYAKSKKAYTEVINHISPVLAQFSVQKELEKTDYRTSVHAEAVAENRNFEGSFVFDWQVGSFSLFKGNFHLDPEAVTTGVKAIPLDGEFGGEDEKIEEDDMPFPDEETNSNNSKNEMKDPASLPGDEEQEAIFSFSAGKDAGTIWHEIFELMDFHPDGLSAEEDFNADTDRMLLEKLPKKSLYTAIRRRKEEDEEAQKRDKAFTRMLKGILCNPLVGKTETIVLKDIPSTQCARELRFLYILKSSATLKQVKECLEKYHIPTGNWADNAEAEHTDWALTGSLDMLCQSKSGRYYVIDWKTNGLSRKMSAFSFAGVTQEINAKMYTLQYLLYTVALWHFIRERLGIELTRENYEKYFGGIFYLFARGIAAPLPEMTDKQKETCRNRGVFYSMPSFDLVDEFKNLFDIRSRTNGTERS